MSSAAETSPKPGVQLPVQPAVYLCMACHLPLWASDDDKDLMAAISQEVVGGILFTLGQGAYLGASCEYMLGTISFHCWHIYTVRSYL